MFGYITKDQRIKDAENENKMLSASLEQANEQITDLQLALVDVYETAEPSESEATNG